MIEAYITDIQIQPIKGGGALKVPEARMTLAGLETVGGGIKDHGLVVVTGEPDAEGHHNFLTQRVQVDPGKNLYVPGDPRLSLLRPRAEAEQLYLSVNGENETPDLGEENDDPSKILPIQVWEHRGGAIEVPIFSQMVSDHLGRSVRVARTSGPWNRMARQNFIPNNNPLRAQDGYPIHAVSFEDAKALFDAIGAPTDANRFRYQVLIEGLGFRKIHDYLRALINETSVDQAKPCDRCEVTGIDQEKGEFSKVKPLAGLSKLGVPRWMRDEKRRAQIVGENWLPNGVTIIRVGDSIFYTEPREVPLKFES